MSGAANGYIAVDLDGTLAHYDGWKGVEYIGAPIAPMVQRVQQWLAEGKTVKIFTARVARKGYQRRLAELVIWAWCQTHIGIVLEVTNVKDMGMVELWDDRCVQVERNTGQPVGTHPAAHMGSFAGTPSEFRNPEPRPWPGTQESIKGDDYR